jgi:alkylhydroperoxidase family enzyme
MPMARVSPAQLPDDMPYKNALVEVTFHNPEMHRGFASLSSRVHSASCLDTRVRELAVLRVAGKLGSEFQWSQHAPVARELGVSDIQLAALRSGDLGAFEGADRAAVAFAGAVDDCAVDDGAWAAAREYFSEQELVDMAMLAGFYGLASRFVRALDIGIERAG